MSAQNQWAAVYYTPERSYRSGYIDIPACNVGIYEGEAEPARKGTYDWELSWNRSTSDPEYDLGVGFGAG